MGIIRDNPILQREGLPKLLRNASPTARFYGLVAAVALSLLLPLLLYSRRWDHNDALAQVIAWLLAGITLFIVPGYAARAITQERMQETWDALVLSRLKPAEIILGKFFAILLPLWMLGLFCLPTCIFLSCATPVPHNSLGSVLLAYGLGWLGSASFTSIGIFFSMLCSSDSSAQILTFLAMLASGIFIGLGPSIMTDLLLPGLPYPHLDEWYFISAAVVIFSLGLCALPAMILYFPKLEKRVR